MSVPSKIRITLKDPDGVADAIEEFLNKQRPDGLTDEEWAEVKEHRIEGLCLTPWVEYQEYVTIEIDLNTKTAVVVPRS